MPEPLEPSASARQEGDLRGRAWVFGPDVNTDLIMPAGTIFLPREEQKARVFAANRPGWAGQVRPGDMIVAGANFGVGSGRPAARPLLDLGITAIVAESLSGMFLRTAVSYGLLAMEVEGITRAVEEGDVLRIDLERWTVEAPRAGAPLPARSIPASLRASMLGGGTLASLVAAGFIDDDQA